MTPNNLTTTTSSAPNHTYDHTRCSGVFSVFFPNLTATPASRSWLSGCVSQRDVTGVPKPQGLAVEAAENGTTVEGERVAAEIFCFANRPDHSWLNHSLSAIWDPEVGFAEGSTLAGAPLRCWTGPRRRVDVLRKRWRTYCWKICGKRVLGQDGVVLESGYVEVVSWKFMCVMGKVEEETVSNRSAALYDTEDEG